MARQGPGRRSGVGPGADPGARGDLGAAGRGAGAGRDRRRGDRQGAGAAGGRPGGDLGGPLDARRPAQAAVAADTGQRLVESRLTSTRPPTWPGPGGRDRGRQGERGRPGRLRLGFPDASSFAPVRAKADVVARLEVGAEPTRSKRRRSRKPPRRWVHRRRRPTMASGGGYSGPLVYRTARGCARMWPPPSIGWRRPPARRHLPAGRLRVPLRRRTGGALRRPSRPDLGGAAGALAASLRDRARPRSRLRLLLARRQRQPLRLRPALLVGGLALRLRHGPAALLGGGQRAERDRGRGDGARAPRPCRASSRLASASRWSPPPRAGTSPPLCWRRS